MPSSQPDDSSPGDRTSGGRFSDWKNAISRAMRGDFGSPGESLRSDIMDELTDHLSESMKREERAGRGEAEARERVLKRFGSPSRIAARLWFDGMKGSIMFQRWMIGLTVVALLISIVTAGAAFWSIDRNNKSLLAAVEKLEEKISASQSMDWVTVKFKCIDADSGNPVKGAEITLSGSLLASTRDQIAVKTVEDGTASFGPIKPGTHILYLYSSQNWHTRKELTVMPGKNSEFVFQCPVTNPTQNSSVSFKLPLVMQGNDKAAKVDIRLVREVDGQKYSFDDGSHDSWYVTPSGQTFAVTRVDGETNLELRSTPVSIYGGEYDVEVSLLKVQPPLRAGRMSDFHRMFMTPASPKMGKLHLTAIPDTTNDWHIVPDNIVPEQWIKEFNDKQPRPLNGLLIPAPIEPSLGKPQRLSPPKSGLVSPSLPLPKED